ncbi:recombinase RecT [Shewanella sp. 202IG2-18]|nr:recombinase RecT [Parashewanella hymeniacidonis]
MQHGMTNTTDMIFSVEAMTQMSNLANFMAGGKSTLPTHLQGNPSDCMAVIMQAAQWQMNPFAVAQKTHLVNGTLGYEAQLVNAVVSSSRAIKGRFKYEWFGAWEKVVGKFETRQGKSGKPYQAPAWKPQDEQGLGVRVWATIDGDEDPTYLELLLTQAQVRNSTLWASDPKQQLAYLAVKRWVRLYTPDVLMGVYTPDELQGVAAKDITPQTEQPQNSKLNNVLKKAKPIEGQVQEVSTDKYDQLAASLLDCSSMNELDEVAQAIANAFQAAPPMITLEQKEILGKSYLSMKKKIQKVDQETGEVIE